MLTLRPPAIVFRRARFTSDTLTGQALAWRDALRGPLGASSGPVAMVMTNEPASVALLFALSALPAPLVLLPPDLAPGRSALRLPPDARLVLREEQQDLAVQARAGGLRTVVAPAVAAPPAPAASPAFMATPGIVLFTSGSLGEPRPVYRRTAAFLAVARALVRALDLPAGAGVIGALPLGRAFGLNHGLMAAAVLGAPLALLDRFDHGAVLRLFASGRYGYWAGTPVMADVLGRCQGPAAQPAPPVCAVGGAVTADLARRFEDRFGVRLRQVYGMTEIGTIAVDGTPAGAPPTVRASRPLPGVGVRVGDDPRAPEPPGTVGRIWVSAPGFAMEGYGVPPALEPPATVEGWWGTPDLGRLDAAGWLEVLGRVDDRIRTDAGHVLDPATVLAALDGWPGVREAAVVPLGAAGASGLGLLLETAGALSVAALRAHLAQALPAWSCPRIIETTAALPRLPGGRIDRRACIARLERASGHDPAG